MVLLNDGLVARNLLAPISKNVFFLMEFFLKKKVGLAYITFLKGNSPKYYHMELLGWLANNKCSSKWIASAGSKESHSIFHLRSLSTNEGSHCSEKAWRTCSNLQYRWAISVATPWLPHMNTSWNSVRNMSSMTTSGWKPVRTYHSNVLNQ